MNEAAARTATGSAVRQALIWNVVNFAANQGAGAIFFFILARHLAPEVFGLFALAVVFVEVFTIQGRSTVMDVLIQRRDFSPLSTSSMFYLAQAVAIVAFGASLMLAGPLAAAMDAPALQRLLPALAVTVLAAPWIAVMEAILMRDLKFRAFTLRNIASVMISGLVGLGVAFSPFAIWALVIQRLSQTLINLIFLVVYTRWVPSLAFSTSVAMSHARGVGPLWAAQGVTVLGGRLVDLIVGLKLGAATLGNLRVASKFVEVIHATLTSAIFNLWVPLMSRVADDPKARGVLFLRLVGFAAMICMPPMIGLALVSEELTTLMLAPAYAPVATIVRFLAVTGFFIPIAFFRTGVFAALGRNGLSLSMAALETGLAAGVAYLLAPQGITTMLAGTVCAYGFTSCITGYLITRAVDVTAADFAKALFPAYLAVAAMTVVVLAASALSTAWPPAARLILMTTLGAAAYAAWLALFHRKWLMINLDLVRRDRSMVDGHFASAETPN
jgi:O-antigen/teichoic acid export membrane protein